MGSVQDREPRTRVSSVNCRRPRDSMAYSVSENDDRPTYLDRPHLIFTVTQWLSSVKTLSVKDHLHGNKIITFQYNSTVVSKLTWLEIKLNLSDACSEKRSLDCQCSTGVDSNVTVRYPSVVYENDDTAKATNVSSSQWTGSPSLNLLDL